MSQFRRWMKDKSGATAIEYGLLLAGVALAILLSIDALSDNLNILFYDRLSDALGE